MAAETVEVLVVGAGQAGIAISEHLRNAQTGEHGARWWDRRGYCSMLAWNLRSRPPAHSSTVSAKSRWSRHSPSMCR